MKKKKLTLGSVILTILLVVACLFLQPQSEPLPSVSLDSIPAYSGEPFVVLNNNVPRFAEIPATDEPEYGELDTLNRCTYTVATLSRELMPTEERGSIGQVKPTGWVTTKYDFVDGKYLYNRCHLIGFQLTGENANERNLITGTRYMNVEGMLPFENMVADYIKETDNRVLYRVIPIFEEDELVARGVTIEAWSVEDNGEGICFYVYIYNVQPGVVINYADGTSYTEALPNMENAEVFAYVVNTSSGKFHLDTCAQAAKIKPENQETFTTTYDQLLVWNFTPAGCCNP